MSIQIATTEPDGVAALMRDIGRRGRAAARLMARAPAEAKRNALRKAADEIRKASPAILGANAADLAEAKELSGSFVDRLTLNPARIEAMAEGVASVAELADPVGTVLQEWTRPNGLRFERVRVPLGVVGIIYESRPNVTADAGALCLMSGNAAILRGGSDGFRTSTAIQAAMQAGLCAAGLPEDAIQFVPTRDRAAVAAMLAGLDGNLDVLVPRGGKSLVARVQAEARVPVFSHLDGNNHVYVHAAADAGMARAVLLNAKLRRTGVCGAAETLLLDSALPRADQVALVRDLLDAGCAVRGDPAVQALDARVSPATDEDWGTEYLDSIIAARVVDGVDAAISHIETFGSHHTDAIVTADVAVAEKFLDEVDSAIVLHNASTQFADGGEFGFGAEIGIATGRMHARGPVGVEQLTSFKYRVHGDGQTRP